MGDSRDAPRTPASDVIRDAARSRIVLLGELHDRADHHRWQLQTVSALAARRPVVSASRCSPPHAGGPRSLGGRRADSGTFLRESDWQGVWGFPAPLYLPLLEFARLNRAPMRALNVDRALVSRVGREGWAAVPVGAREGVSDPAPPTSAYRTMLAEAMAAHGGEAAPSDAGMQRFVEAQLTWDRALAEGLVAAAREHPDALIVGIMGTGHLEHGYGVPHQLAALGERSATVLLPWDTDRDCAKLTPDLADAVFGIAPAVEAPDHGPHLGVTLAPARDGVRVADVTPGASRPPRAARDDVVVEAAGTHTTTPADLRAVVDAQAPGTWLPLRVRRGPARARSWHASAPVLNDDAHRARRPGACVGHPGARSACRRAPRPDLQLDPAARASAASTGEAGCAGTRNLHAVARLRRRSHPCRWARDPPARTGERYSLALAGDTAHEVEIEYHATRPAARDRRADPIGRGAGGVVSARNGLVPVVRWPVHLRDHHRCPSRSGRSRRDA